MSLKIRSIWDNEGETIDRITVVTTHRDSSTSHLLSLSISMNPNSPQGVSMFGDCVEGDHLGKKIELKDLPTEIQKHIKNRLK